MRLRPLLRGFLTAAALALVATPAARPQTDNGNFTCFPLTGGVFTDPCTGEDVLITDGQSCISQDVRVDGSGGLHIDFHFRSDFTGVGLTTGATYTEHDAANETVNYNGNNPQNNYTFTQNYHVNTSGGKNNLYIHEIFHVTVNAQGQVTAVTFTDEFFGCK